MKTKKKASIGIFKMTATAAMVALSVILCRFLGIAPEGALWRFELGFLPLAFVGRLFGPWYSGLGYLVADIIGSFVHGYAPNPWISLCKLLTGFIMGVFFHKRRFKFPTCAIAFLIIGFFIDFLLMSPIFIFMYGNEPSVAFLTRAVNAAVNAPLRIGVLYLLGRSSEKQLSSLEARRRSGSELLYSPLSVSINLWALTPSE